MRDATPSQAQRVLDLVRARGLVRARDVLAAGLPTALLTRLVAQGALSRSALGIYALANGPMHEHRSLAEVSLRLPAGVVCLLTALRFHELGTQAPASVWLAIPSDHATPRQAGVRCVRMADAGLATGVIHQVIDGVSVPIFSPAKTIADCFKYRSTVGLDVALEALRDAWEHRRVTMDEVWQFARVNRVARLMQPYLEMLIA